MRKAKISTRLSMHSVYSESIQIRINELEWTLKMLCSKNCGPTVRAQADMGLHFLRML